MELKFAVVREDPALEAELVRRTGARAVLLVASGGCTILSLAVEHPALAITAFDMNPEQLAHVERKAAALERGDRVALGVGEAGGLNQSGAFEQLFAVLRTYVERLVARPGDVERYFLDPSESARIAREWVESRYWAAAFETAFNAPFLNAMFGPDATQHAEPGSYPGYFQAAFTRGLLEPRGPENPFLAHVLLGRYVGRAVPDYLRAPVRGPIPRPELVLGGLEAVERLERFDVISLSNVFDWSDDALVERWASLVTARARPGCAVLLRQLNNRRDLRRWFEPTFRFDDALGEALGRADRSLFYERIEVGFRAPA
ncbi:BtaA family protein [Myxococcota bacterium]|nr:BtaA family protein [Myxococcota bacterium]